MVGRGVYNETDSFFTPNLDREGAICSLEDARWWLQIVLPVSRDERNLCPVSGAL
jgi:hypothetical protein